MSPTFEWTPRFDKDWADMSPDDHDRFKQKVTELLVPALAASTPMPDGLRIKDVQRADGVFELTWAGNGRATFEYGEELIPGQSHIVWRRIGGHEIFGTP